jgi:ArsR family transcriptional regulator
MKDRDAIFKVFSNEVRLKIFEFLLDGNMCVSGIVNRLHVTQPTVTQHLKILQQAGLIKSEKIGYWMHYSINDSGLNKTKKELRHFIDNLTVKKIKCTVPVVKCPAKKS